MKFYTIAQAAEIFQVDPRTIRRWIKSDQIGAFRVGRMIRIPEESLLAVTSNPVGDVEDAEDD